MQAVELRARWYEEYRHDSAVVIGETEQELLWTLAMVPGQRWTKRQLEEVLGYGDRRIRKAVELLKRAGFPVLSESGGKGYWLSYERGEVATFVRMELDSRIAVLQEQREALLRTEARMHVFAPLSQTRFL